MKKITYSLLLLFSTTLSAQTLQAVQERGFIKCGVSQGLPGFSNTDEKNNWTGLDVDFCKAVAASVLKDKNKVRFIPTSAKERFTALQSGEIDILSRNTTWTLSRDSALGINFIGPMFYDGQAFMVRKNYNLKSVTELDGAIVCTNSGTTTELNIADFFRSHNLRYEVITFENADEVVSAYEANRCDAYSTDSSGLAAQRLKLSHQDEHVILGDIVSKEPLSPAVRQGDDEWENIVRWVYFALLNAEEYGVNSNNIQKMLTSSNPNIKRLLGVEGNMGEKLGLDEEWARRAILQLGNYAEIYERNVGLNSPLKIERKLNKLWKDGGLMYAPPIR